MLYLLKNNKLKYKKRIFIGDQVNLIYRFKGVFYSIEGTCVFFRKKTVCIYLKKRGYSLFFISFLLNLRDYYILETFLFNNIKWKNLYRLI